jgi:DNA-binding GntR family transcriptional regulator
MQKHQMQKVEPIIDQSRVVDAVRTRLRQAILEGQLEPGAKLSVPALARKLNVSRSPVREAVMQLVAEGLAVEQARRGVIVSRVEGADLLEIHQLEQPLAGLAARLCAQNASPEALRLIHGVLETQTGAVNAGDAGVYRETDDRFHSLIAVNAGNRRLERVLEGLRAELRLGLLTAARNPAHLRRGLREHRAILRALEKRDPEAAEVSMRSHIANTRAEVERQLEREWKAQP